MTKLLRYKISFQQFFCPASKSISILFVLNPTTTHRICKSTNTYHQLPVCLLRPFSLSPHHCISLHNSIPFPNFPKQLTRRQLHPPNNLIHIPTPHYRLQPTAILYSTPAHWSLVRLTLVALNTTSAQLSSTIITAHRSNESSDLKPGTQNCFSST